MDEGLKAEPRAWLTECEAPDGEPCLVDGCTRYAVYEVDRYRFRGIFRCDSYRCDEHRPVSMFWGLVDPWSDWSNDR